MSILKMNKAVIITGCEGGIGIELSQSFKKAGWYVIGIDKSRKDNDINRCCDKFYEFDLSNCSIELNTFKNLVKLIDNELISQKKYLKGIINNAAFQLVKQFEQISAKEWNYLFSVNLFAPIEISKAFMPHLKISKGSILNIGSIHSELTKPFFSAYAVSKAALRGLTQSLAVEFGDEVRVNSIEPAAIKTSMLEESFNGDMKGLEKLKLLHPTKSLGNPNDISKAALFLMDSEQKFINGEILKISGGIHCRLHDIY